MFDFQVAAAARRREKSADERVSLMELNFKPENFRR
jgi:hypothetical protein